MGTRRWGLTVIAAVLLGAVIVPQIPARTVAGSARMAPSPGPPVIGDCVMQSMGGTEAMSGTQPILTAGSWVAFSAVPAVGCGGGGRYGEVADVIPGDQAKALASQDEAGTAIDLRCADAIHRYVGLGPSGEVPMFKSWMPAANVSPFVAGPSQLQASAGQSWVACIAAIYGSDGQSMLYGQPLRNMFANGHLTPALSVCVQTTDPTVSAVGPCSQPHDEETLANTTGTPATSAALSSTCLALARAFTGMLDPTAAGQLKVYVTPHPDTADAAGAVPQCAIASTNIHHKLVGPLIGLGTKAVPWE